MQIQILCIGKIKDAYISSGIAEFEKRLRPYGKIFITELAEVKIPENASVSEELRVKEREGELILANAKEGFMKIALDPNGTSLSSEEFADVFRDAKLSGKNLCFIIGGPLGLSPELLKSAEKKLSLSRMTFTHPMTRLILLEQVYRAFRILNGEP
ncbi:MAG: 23S rRNA (pseudouridine(1915)-N(3))-methyltransferase RlmH, partial [Anaerovoracaceae bacterium]